MMLAAMSPGVLSSAMVYDPSQEPAYGGTAG
jgi:hypothetical protein